MAALAFDLDRFARSKAPLVVATGRPRKVKLALNKNKIVATAQKFQQKGQLDKAIKELQRLVDEDPKDVRTLLKIGDLHTKKGDRKEATDAYNRVAEFYSSQGFFLKAVAVYKQILRVDQSMVDVNVKLAELYHQLGLVSDAMNQFQTVVSHYERQGLVHESMMVLQKMVELDPDNVASRIKLAELCAAQGMTGEAVREFEEAANFLRSQQRQDDFLKVSERLVFFAPQQLGTLKELAEIYLQRGDSKRALAKLQLCFKLDPRDVQTLGLLAQAFISIDQQNKAVSVYKELAKLYTELGQSAEADKTWVQIGSLAPDDPDFIARSNPGQAPIATAPAILNQAMPVPAQAAAPVPMAASANDGRLEECHKLLTETDVYIKYGLKDRALEHVKKIFVLDPDFAPAYDKQRSIALAMGDRNLAARAVENLVRIALTQQNQAEAARLVDELEGFLPGYAGLPNLRKALLGGPLQLSPASTADDFDDVAVEISISEVSLEDEEESFASDADSTRDLGPSLDLSAADSLDPPADEFYDAPGPASPPPPAAAHGAAQGPAMMDLSAADLDDLDQGEDLLAEAQGLMDQAINSVVVGDSSDDEPFFPELEPAKDPATRALLDTLESLEDEEDDFEEVLPTTMMSQKDLATLKAKESLGDDAPQRVPESNNAFFASPQDDHDVLLADAAGVDYVLNTGEIAAADIIEDEDEILGDDEYSEDNEAFGEDQILGESKAADLILGADPSGDFANNDAVSSQDVAQQYLDAVLDGDEPELLDADDDLLLGQADDAHDDLASDQDLLIPGVQDLASAAATFPDDAEDILGADAAPDLRDDDTILPATSDDDLSEPGQEQDFADAEDLENELHQEDQEPQEINDADLLLLEDAQDTLDAPDDFSAPQETQLAGNLDDEQADEGLYKAADAVAGPAASAPYDDDEFDDRVDADAQKTVDKKDAVAQPSDDTQDPFAAGDGDEPEDLFAATAQFSSPTDSFDGRQADQAAEGDTFQASPRPDQEAMLREAIAKAEARRKAGTTGNLAEAESATEIVGLSDQELADIRAFADKSGPAPSPKTTSDAPDGDAPDGDLPDGDLPDGDAPDGDAPDGDAPDGDAPDSGGTSSFADRADHAAESSFSDDVALTDPGLGTHDPASVEKTDDGDAAQAPVHDPAEDFFPDELEEADFFIRQGLYEEATDILQSILEDVPDSFRAQGMLDRIAQIEAGEDEDEAQESEPSSGSASADQSFDLAAELLDDLDELDLPSSGGDEDFQYSVDEVFSEFKRGIEKTVSADDAETHYDLGIAYREMGLIEDAIHEFEMSAPNSDKQADSLYMIGICHQELGRPQEAVTRFREALKNNNIKPNQKMAILFELGTAYQQLDNVEKALNYLQKVYNKNPKFKDVANRVKALGGGDGELPQPVKKGKNISYL